MIPFTWFRQLCERLRAQRSMIVIQGDALPAQMPKRALVLLREDGEDWSVGMLCPCGCKQRVELPLIREVKPSWRLTLEQDGSPTLLPSVWLREGCRSHFFLKRGRVQWVR